MSFHIPLLTDHQGPSQRLRVDPGQTGFFAGRMFRALTEQNIPIAGPAVSFRFTSPVDFILWDQRLDLTQGAIRFEVFTSAIDGGGWTTSVPIIGVNRMAERPQPYYISQVTIDTGGTFIGGTRVDVSLVRAGTSKDSAQNIGSSTSERGLPAGTYFGKFSTLTGGTLPITDPAQMVYTLNWEERV